MTFKSLIEKYKSMSLQVKAAMWFFICSVIQRGIAFITTPIFTRLMSTSDYGQYNVFTSWMSMLTVIVTLNLTAGVYIQGLVKFEKDRNRFTSSLMGLLTCLSLGWLVIYLLLQKWINPLISLSTDKMLLMFCLMWTTSIFGFWSIDKRVDFDYKPIVIVSLLFAVANPTISILFIVNSEDKAMARIIGMALTELVLFGWMFVKLMHKGKKWFSAQYWPYVVKFNLSLIPHYLASSVLSSSDRIMIERIVGESEAGIYSLAYSVSMIMTMVSSALTQTIEPWIYKKIRDKQEKTIEAIAYPSLIIVAVANIILIALAPEIIRIFAPAEYYDAIWVIPPVSMSTFFMFAYSFFAAFEFYYEKTKLISIATFIGSALNIALNFVCIKIFGYVAAGYTTLVCYMAYTFAHYAFMRTILRENHVSEKIYNLKVLIMIMSVFVIIGFLFTMTYTIWQLRYLLAASIMIICSLKRDLIKKFIRQLLSIRAAK